MVDKSTHHIMIPKHQFEEITLNFASIFARNWKSQLQIDMLISTCVKHGNIYISYKNSGIHRTRQVLNLYLQEIKNLNCKQT